MSVQLLDKTRKINRLLHNTGEKGIVFSDICRVLSETLNSTVIITSKKGKLLARCDGESIGKITELLTEYIGECIDYELNERLRNTLSTKENVNFETLGFGNVSVEDKYGLFIPIDIAGRRLGSVFSYREEKAYNIEDIILGEYGASVIGLEIMRAINQENSENERKLLMVQSAISTLSFSEQEALKHIFKELDGVEGVVVASKIADKVGIARSVIVNALRKFESAGVIETRSLGMKGTYLKVLNNLLINELK